MEDVRFDIAGLVRDSCVRHPILRKNAKGVDVVVCDVAPNTKGYDDSSAQTDVVREVFRAATTDLLKVGHKNNALVCKVFMGSGSEGIAALFKKHFKTFKRTKPKSTRKESKEIYFVGQGLIKQWDLGTSDSVVV